jgi:hypothetical protein
MKWCFLVFLLYMFPTLVGLMLVFTDKATIHEGIGGAVSISILAFLLYGIPEKSEL